MTASPNRSEFWSKQPPLACVRCASAARSADPLAWDEEGRVALGELGQCCEEVVGLCTVGVLSGAGRVGRSRSEPARPRPGPRLFLT
eukprot:2803010-Alexandrium_andersonii.AAC.1